MALRNYASPIPLAAEPGKLPSYRRAESNPHRMYPGSTSILKHESSVRQEQETRWENLPYEPPVKRQRVEDGTPGLKFVSQEKWKFSSNQPWIEVNPAVTSKARNAVCIGKQDSIEKNSKIVKQSQQPPGPPAPRFTHDAAQKMKGPEQTPSNATAKPNRADKSKRLQDHSEAAQAQTGIFQKTLSFAQPNEPNVQEAVASQDVHGQQIQSHALNVVQTPNFLSPPQQPVADMNMTPNSASPYIEVGPTKIVPRTVSAPDKGLSLEKDSDRIAALIAAKRRDNEASMFRQKMLQRQIEHRTQTSSRKLTGSMPRATNIDDQNVSNNSNVLVTSTIHNVRSSRSVSPNACQKVIATTAKHNAQLSTEHRSATLHNISNKIVENPKTSELGRHKRERPLTTQCELHAAPKVTDTLNKVSSGLESGSKIHPTEQNRTRPEFYGKIAATPARQLSTNIAHRVVAQGSDAAKHFDSNNGFTASKSPRGDSSTNVTTQIVAAPDQIIVSGSESSDTPPNVYTDQLSRYAPASHQQRTMAPNSTIRTHTSNTPSPSTYHRSLPVAQLHAQPQKFTANNEAQESGLFPRQFGTQYPQSRLHSHLTPSATPPLAAPTYYNINQNFFLGSNQTAFSQTTSPTAVHSQSSPVSLVTDDKATVTNLTASGQNGIHRYSHLQASFHMTPRNLPQPPVLVSNMNMFSGEARISSANSVRPEAVKRERVNMFMSRNGATGSSAGPGMIMAMEDVRRGIEMT